MLGIAQILALGIYRNYGERSGSAAGLPVRSSAWLGQSLKKGERMTTDFVVSEETKAAWRKENLLLNKLAREALATVQEPAALLPERLDWQRVFQWLEELFEDFRQVAQDPLGQRQPQSEAWRSLMQVVREICHQRS